MGEEMEEDLMAGNFHELDFARTTLDSRYDEIKCGKVKLIPGDTAYARLMESIEARRSEA